MLDPLELADPAGFAAAIGAPEPDKPSPKTLGGTVAEALAALGITV